MNFYTYTLRITPLYIAFLFFSFLTKAQETHEECYNTDNAGTVGDASWTGCANMYIVADRAALKSAVDNDSYKITHENTDYTQDTTVSYTVYDLTGRQLATHQVRGTTHSLDISALPTGNYLLQAKKGNQKGVFRFAKE